MKISIITVTYNSEKYLKQCIQSIRDQTHKDIQHVVIDNNSKDSTLKIIDKLKIDDSIIISEDDEGIYHAMNKGIENSSGDIIGILNSDDFYADQKVLEVVNEIFTNNMIDACYGDLHYVKPEKTDDIVRRWKSGKFKIRSFSKGWVPPHPTFFVRRSIYDELGKFDINYKFASDTDLMMRFLEVAKIKAVHVDKNFINMRTGGKTNKTIKNIVLQNVEILASLKKNNVKFNFFSFFLNKAIDRFAQYRAARTHKKIVK